MKKKIIIILIIILSLISVLFIYKTISFKPKEKKSIKEKEVKSKKILEINVEEKEKVTNKEIQNDNKETVQNKADTVNKETNTNIVSNKEEKEVEEKKPWDELGMSQYDYENKPAMSWMHVDFQNMDECATYGDEYIIEHDGSYTCHDVTTLSGKYLGVMFEYKAIEN